MGDNRRHYGQLRRGAYHRTPVTGTYVDTPGWRNGKPDWLATDCKVLVARSSLVCRVCNGLVPARTEFITVPVGRARARPSISVCVPCFNAKRLEAAALAAAEVQPTPGSDTAAPPPPSTAGPGASGTPAS